MMNGEQLQKQIRTCVSKMKPGDIIRLKSGRSVVFIVNDGINILTAHNADIGASTSERWLSRVMIGWGNIRCYQAFKLSSFQAFKLSIRLVVWNIAATKYHQQS